MPPPPPPWRPPRYDWPVNRFHTSKKIYLIPGYFFPFLFWLQKFFKKRRKNIKILGWIGSLSNRKEDCSNKNSEMIKRNERVRADYQEQNQPLKMRVWDNSLLNYYSMISHCRYVFGRTLILSEDMPKNTEKKEGPEVPQRKNVLLAGIAIGLILIVIVAVFILIQPSLGSGKAYPPATINTTIHDTGPSPSQTTRVPKTIHQTSNQTINETATVQTTTSVPVDFVLQSGNPASCGLTCRQLDATLTNSGYLIAHNVCIAVNMHNSRNEIINLNGDSSFSRCVGDIPGGQTKTESITINADCGAFASKCIGETLTLQTKVTSVEKTVQFPDQLIAV